MKWPEDVRLTILPSTPLSLQLLFMFSSKRFVRRKWPAIQVKRYCILRISMLITHKNKPKQTYMNIQISKSHSFAVKQGIRTIHAIGDVVLQKTHRCDQWRNAIPGRRRKACSALSSLQRCCCQMYTKHKQSTKQIQSDVQIQLFCDL